VIAAEQYASRLVVPSSQRFGAKRWPSHKDHAAKALQKLVGPHVPATLKQLEKAIAKAHAELQDAQSKPSPTATNGPRPLARPVARRRMSAPWTTPVNCRRTPTEFAEDHFDDEDTVDVAGALGPDGHVDSNADPGL